MVDSVSFLVAALIIASTPLRESPPERVLDFFGRPPTFAGVVVTVQGVGAIAGGITATRWIRRLGEAGAVTIGMGLLALSLTIVALTSTLWVTLVAVVVLGYSLPLTFIALMTMLQRRTPQAHVSRQPLDLSSGQPVSAGSDLARPAGGGGPAPGPGDLATGGRRVSRALTGVRGRPAIAWAYGLLPQLDLASRDAPRDFLTCP